MYTLNKYSQTITMEFSKIPTTLKRSPIKLGSEFPNSIFQNFLKAKIIQHWSREPEKGLSIAEKVIRTLRSLLKKPIFENRNANWLSELLVVINKYNNTIHHSIRRTPVQASKKSNEN